MAWGMSAVSVALFGLLLSGPPALPPDVEDAPPAEDASRDAPEPPAAEDPPAVEEPPVEDAAPPAEEPPADDAAPPADDSIPVDDGGEVGPPGEDAIPVAPADDDGGPPDAGDGAGTVQQPSTPAVQQPSKPNPQTPATTTEGPELPPEPDLDAEPEAVEPEEQEEESYKKLGGFRLFRLGLAAKIGYTHGTSNKNGLYDRDKSIQNSIDNMMVGVSGAGDLGKTKFGGFQYGFILDAEVVGINVWLDFHKFFTPGGMWSLLLGYDHEFGFGKRLRLDVGVGGGLNQVFLGKVLSSLYYDQDNPEAVNIGTLGVEGRAMVDLHIKLVGPLFTGPYVMLGYHYLWSANVEEVTAEKGLHYSAGWTLRLDLAAPKIIGGRKKKKS